MAFSVDLTSLVAGDEISDSKGYYMRKTCHHRSKQKMRPSYRNHHGLYTLDHFPSSLFHHL